MTNENLSVYDRICRTRKSGRATASDYINATITDFVELHGDRCFADDHAIVGGIGRLNGKPVTVIGIEKGRDLNERLLRNFGCVLPEGYRKALRLMKQAEKFDRPIITFIDTPGAYPGMGAEERGQGEAIARNLFEMSKLKVPTISIVIGEGSSGGALALGVTDIIIMFENAVYSILSPEGFASILYKDTNKSQEAAEKMKITSKELKKLGVIDSIVKEPEGGAQEDFEKVCKDLKNMILKDINRLSKKSQEELVEQRYEKYRKIGGI